MLDPNIQQINNIPQTDATSDIAGGSAVQPSYIASDVPDYTEVNGSAGIDSVEVSTGVSTPTVDISAAPENEETSNYIQSDVPAEITVSDLLDGYDMNSLEEIEDVSKYIDPEDAAVQALLMNLKDWGIISSGMSQDDVAYAIHGYVISTFAYKPDISGDVWFSPSQTLANGGGDCEDLANLMASLITAALMDRGMSLEDASKRTGCVVIGEINYGTAHVYVRYAGDDGSVKYLDSVSSRVLDKMASSKILLFSYNAEAVDVIDNAYDYSMLNTAADDPNLIHIPQDTSTYRQITDFEGYWLSPLEMKASAPAVISALQSFINTYGSYGSTFGCTAELTTISNFLSALQGSYVQDSATVAAFCKILTNLDTTLTTYVNQRPEVNFSDALVNWRNQDMGRLNSISDLFTNTVNIYLPDGNLAGICWNASAEWIHNKIEAGYTIDMNDTFWIIYNQRHQAVDNNVQYASAADAKALSDFETAQTTLFSCERLAAEAQTEYNEAYSWYTENDLGLAEASKITGWLLFVPIVDIQVKTDATAEWICDKEANEYAVVGNVDEARRRRDRWVAAQANLPIANQNVSNAQTAVGSASSAYDTAYNALVERCSLVRTAQNMDNDVKALKNSSTLTNYYNYSVKYANSFTTTTNYISAISSTLQMGENRLESIGDTLIELNKMASVLNADVSIPYYKQVYKDKCDAFDPVYTEYCTSDLYNIDIVRDNWHGADGTHHWQRFEDVSVQFCEAKWAEWGVTEANENWASVDYDHDGMGDLNATFRTRRDNYDTALEAKNDALTAWNKSVTDYIDVALSNGYISQQQSTDLKAILTGHADGSKNVEVYDTLKGYVANHTINTTSMNNYALIYDDPDGIHHTYTYINAGISTLTVAQLESQFFTPTTITNANGTTTTYYTLSDNIYIGDGINPDGTKNPHFLNLVNMLNSEINTIKGTIMILALVFEAKRDLWGLVNKELQGTEEAGYKGMDISSLFASEIERTVTAFYTFLKGLVNAINVLNQTEYDIKKAEINDDYDERSQEISDKGDSLDDMFKNWDVYWNQEKYQNQNESDRDNALKGLSVDYKAVITANLTVFAGILSGMGLATGIDAINDAIAKILSGEIEIYTPDETDDPWYKQIDYDLVGSLREEIEGAVQNVRIQSMAAETMTQMRNLVHQEMTGISGREMRTDVTSEMVETEQDAVLDWFDKTVDMADTKVEQENQIRYYDINIDKLKAELEELGQWYNQVLNFFEKTSAIGLAIVGGVIGGIFGGPAGAMLGASIGATLGEMIGGVFGAVKDFITGVKFLFIEYEHNDVIKPKEYHYTPVNPTTVHLNTTGTNPEDNALNIAAGADNQIDEELENMDSDTYLETLDDGHNTEISLGDLFNPLDLLGNTLEVLGGVYSFSGSSAFDTAAFAAACEKINNYQALITVVDGIRRDTEQLRSLVHMEMTGIGGRTTSNMLTYAMEAARGQMAFVANLANLSLQGENQSRNMEYQRNRNILKAIQNIANSVENGFLSLIPIIGTSLANQNDMYTAKETYEEQGKADFETDATFANDLLNGLIANGLLDTGDGNKGVDYTSIAKVRAQITRESIANAVKSAVAKASGDMRSLVHMEMTGVRSASSDIASGVNTAQFEAAMDTLSLITQYLSEKATVHNNALEAQRMAGKIQDQINNNWANMVTTVICEVIGYYTGYGIFELIGSLGSVIFNLLNAYNDVTFETARANDDTGDLATLIAAKKIMNDSVNSTETRLDELEKECLEEITEELFQNTGYGTLGVNKGIASRYKSALEKAARAERTIKSVKDALQELRNTVNEMLTGVSGITSNATDTALSMKLQQAKSNIDDAFSLLEELADRKNDITDAERDLSSAKVKMTMAIVSAVISVVTSVAHYKWGKANDVASDADQLKNNAYYGNLLTNLNLLNLVVNLALNFYQKDQLTADEIKRENRDIKVNGKTVTKSQKSSNIQASEMQDVSSFEDLAAVYQEKAGQANIMHKALANRFKLSQINNEFNQNMVSGLNELTATVGGITKKNLAMKKENETVNMKEGEAKKVESGKAVGAPAGAQDAKETKKTAAPVIYDMKQLHNDLVDAGKGLKKCYFSGYKVKAIDPNELHKAVDKLDFAVTQVLNAVKESIKCPNFTKDASTPSSSNTLAYADYILNSMEGTAKPSEAQNASSGGVESAEKPTIEDLKKALENAKKQLVDAQKELGKAMTELKAAKDSLPIKVAQTAGVKVAIDNEIQRLVKEAKEIDNKVLEFDGLAEKHPEAKALIDGCRNSLNDQLNKINKEWEKAGFKTAAAEVGEKEAKKQVSDAKDKVAQAKGEIGDTKYKISSLSKELKDLLAEAKKGTVNNITPMYKEA